MPEPGSQPGASEPGLERAPGGEAGRAGATIAAWRQAGENLDAERAIVLLAPGVELISPLTAQFTFKGRDQVANVLTAAFEVITEIRYHTEVGDDRTRALFYYGQCGRQAFEEAQLIRLDAEGLITEITLFGRPLPGLTAVMTRIAPAVLRLQGRGRLGRVLGAATVPLHAMAVSGEQRVVPLADPHRPAGKRPRRPLYRSR
jgi:hypothetical protein